MKRFTMALGACATMLLISATSAAAYEDCGDPNKFKPGGPDQAKCLTRLSATLTKDVADLLKQVSTLQGALGQALKRGDSVTLHNLEINMNRDVCLTDTTGQNTVVVAGCNNPPEPANPTQVWKLH